MSKIKFEIVKVKKEKAFVDSLTIAEWTGVEHESVARMIKKYKDNLEKIGELRFMDLKSGNPLGGRSTKVYELSEQQASFFLMLSQNTNKVVEFKFKLNQEFYKMREVLQERQGAQWQMTRKDGKLVRRKETDALALLKVYAEEQREGKPHNFIYLNYSKLVNKSAGIGSNERDKATIPQLNFISLGENMIERIVLEEMKKCTFYKDIYRICKEKVELISETLDLPNNLKQIE